MRKLFFLKILFSPFKRFRLKFYAGKLRLGVPYFFPRVWKKSKTNSETKIPVPKIIGFDLCGLGWKTKWTDTDYRFEWNPVLSFVFFKWQLAVSVVVDNPDEYWTAFLYYNYNTDKTKSKKERINQCKKEFPLMFTVWSNGEDKIVNYYEIILKSKYKDLLKDEIRNNKIEQILNS